MAGSNSSLHSDKRISSRWLFLQEVTLLMLLTTYLGAGNPVIAPSPVVTTYLGGTINITCIKPNEAMEVAWETGLLPLFAFRDENNLVVSVNDISLNGSFIYCIARYPSQPVTFYTSDPVVLLIQGTLGSFELTKVTNGPCEVKITWNSPFTLPGVPILGYQINITNQDTGTKDIIFTKNRNISLILDYNYTVAVSGVNSAGVGNVSVVNASSVLNYIHETFSSLNYSNPIPSRIANEWKANISLSNYNQQHKEILEDTGCNAFIVINFINRSDSETVFTSKETHVNDEELLSNDPIVMKEDSRYNVTIALKAFQRQAKVFESANIGELSTFDVQDINNDDGNDCLRTEYVDGSNISKCRIKLNCSNELLKSFILNGGRECLNETVKNATCVLEAYDCANDDCVNWEGPAVTRNITISNVSSVSSEAIEGPSSISYVKSTIHPSTTDTTSASEMAYPSDTVVATNSIEPYNLSMFKLIAVIVGSIITIIIIIIITIMIVLVLYFKKSNTVKSCDSESNHAQESYKSKRNNAKESCENNKQCAEGNFPEKFHRNEDDDQESTL
ncbi:PREDICTED: uncharacterized protein LOC109585745 [Amphimedon queenslandica]|uniref:Fibronectin type-III domain-containing protein n=1 Tax=Amphimedon queenslandica TaxID=400682 RepID=A0A1X7TW38_AMPQE|nr:PREDICTED: uncharacterized protein LOC109585745 [Amphimedon queenslandica]XP_019857431.1 PREDICTED: uncharacterized protein LOC109585745 [Amphimedon queenslandica]|eukprot:XP_019857430.1 PREDICTED: uncharacterized protein LOC109585745 [Amphimedon queenslandica]